MRTFINDQFYPCEFYMGGKNRNIEMMFIHDQPVDHRVIFKTETIDGLLVVTEDDDGYRYSWTLEP